MLAADAELETRLLLLSERAETADMHGSAAGDLLPFSDALARARDAGLTKLAAEALQRRGALLDAWERYDEAKECAREARDLARRARAPEIESAALTLDGLVECRRGRALRGDERHDPRHPRRPALDRCGRTRGGGRPVLRPSARA